MIHKMFRPNLLLILISSNFLNSCQPPVDETSTVPSLEQVAREVIGQSGPCTLITIDSLGQPRARIMDAFPPEENFVIWFGTNTLSRKVKEIFDNERVTINYFDKPNGAYVSLYGRAEIIHDDSLKITYWKPAWQDFYPNYPKGYCLIRFTPDYLEVISEKHGINGDPRTWKPATLNF